VNVSLLAEFNTCEQSEQVLKRSKAVCEFNPCEEYEQGISFNE
jgi:hypothetical protein